MNVADSMNLKTLKKQQCPSGLIFEGSEYDHVLCNTPRSGFSITLLISGEMVDLKYFRKSV